MDKEVKTVKTDNTVNTYNTYNTYNTDNTVNNGNIGVNPELDYFISMFSNKSCDNISANLNLLKFKILKNQLEKDGHTIVSSLEKANLHIILIIAKQVFTYSTNFTCLFMINQLAGNELIIKVSTGSIFIGTFTITFRNCPNDFNKSLENSFFSVYHGTPIPKLNIQFEFDTGYSITEEFNCYLKFAAKLKKIVHSICNCSLDNKNKSTNPILEQLKLSTPENLQTLINTTIVEIHGCNFDLNTSVLTITSTPLDKFDAYCLLMIVSKYFNNEIIFDFNDVISNHLMITILCNKCTIGKLSIYYYKCDKSRELVRMAFLPNSEFFDKFTSANILNPFVNVNEFESKTDFWFNSYSNFEAQLIEIIRLINNMNSEFMQKIHKQEQDIVNKQEQDIVNKQEQEKQKKNQKEQQNSLKLARSIKFFSRSKWLNISKNTLNLFKKEFDRIITLNILENIGSGKQHQLNIISKIRYRMDDITKNNLKEDGFLFLNRLLKNENIFREKLIDFLHNHLEQYNININYINDKCIIIHSKFVKPIIY